MRILFVDTSDAEFAFTWSGTTSRVLEQLRLKHDVILLHRLSKWMKCLYVPYVLECKRRHLQFQLDRHEWVARQYANQVRKAYASYHPDIVFSVSTIPLAYLPAEIPTATWTDAIMPDMVEFYWSSQNFHRRSLEAGIQLDKLALRRNKASIFSSEWAAESARRFVPDSLDRIFCVCFGANTVADPPLNGPKLLMAAPQVPIRFIFVGGDWTRKGGQDAVDALKILRSDGYNIHLSIIGTRPFSDGFDSDFVHQYGFLRRDVEDERAQHQRLYRESHFFILPTHAECSPIVLAEAASYGLPVITRDVGGISSMVTHGLNGILINHNDGPQALAEAIRPLLTDAERYRAMSASALEIFAERLNWKTAVDQVGKILENVSSLT